MFKPFSDRHAIKQVVFALEFETLLSSGVLQEISESEVHDRLVEMLPRYIPNRGLIINFPVAQVAASGPNVAQQLELSGLVYDKLLPNGTAETSVSIQRNMLVVTRGAYQRWADEWRHAKAIFEMLLPFVSKNVKVATVGFQVVDEFTTEGPKAEVNFRELFKSSTRYMPLSMLDGTGPRHSHHGFFKQDASIHPHKELHNVNVDVNEQARQFVVTITATHKWFLKDPVVPTTEAHPLEMEIGERVFNLLHTANKEMLGDMLTESIQERIHFNKPADQNA